MPDDKEKETALDAIAQRVNAAHKASVRLTQEALLHAREAGQLLIEAKAMHPHGSWTMWVSNRCHMSPRTAQDYMRVARHWEELEPLVKTADTAGSEKRTITTIAAALEYLKRARFPVSTAPQRETATDTAGEPTETVSVPPRPENWITYHYFWSKKFKDYISKQPLEKRGVCAVAAIRALVGCQRDLEFEREQDGTPGFSLLEVTQYLTLTLEAAERERFLGWVSSGCPEPESTTKQDAA